MKSVFQKCLIALLAILWGVSSVQAQSVNMSRYITLTVEKGADILLDIAADAANTPIKIVSGDKEQTITVGTSWTGGKELCRRRCYYDGLWRCTEVGLQ